MESSYLESEDTFLPGSHTGQVDFSEGLVERLHICAVRSRAELVCYRLAGFCHDCCVG